MLAKLRHPPVAWTLGLLTTAIAAAVVVPAVDPDDLRRAAAAAGSQPLLAAVVLLAYLAAFLLRAAAWQRLLPSLSLGHALAGIHLALGGNHVLPLRLGEALRVTSVVRRAGVGLQAATASTLALRAGDLVALAVIALVAGPKTVVAVTGSAAVAALIPVGAGILLIAGLLWTRRVQRSGQAAMRLPGPGVAALVLAAWLLESAVLWAAARWVGVDLDPATAVLVTTVTVAAQTLAIAPGGFGTYEAAGTAALVAVGVDPTTGLAVALTAHAVKTAYSLLAGAVALVAPDPSLLGRLRLPRSRPPRPPAQPAAEDDPVVLFLPAKDEQATIAEVVRRAPHEVHGRPVEVVVVDDGSTDATAARARAAGARVLHHDRNRGLGAAVATGLAHAVARRAAAVAFCDADGEYAPEELAALVAPVLEGRADYVVGSRFQGHIGRMLPHRRFGNLVLTAALRLIARRAITDGQSGYRALSPAAAAAAELVHDYNYAQVLTLDLLAKGFRYAEVPISYCFREHGRSFVRLPGYLRHVVPAVLRTVNRV